MRREQDQSSSSGIPCGESVGAAQGENLELSQNAVGSSIRNDVTQSTNLLTPEDVAAELKVTAEQVRNLIRHGQLAAVNVGAGKKRPLYRITRQGLQDFLSRRYQPGPAVRPKRFRRLPTVPDLFPNLR